MLHDNINIYKYKALESYYNSFKSLKLAVNPIHNLQNQRKHLWDGGYNHNPIVS
jgi:hypothetical protein